MRKRDKAELRMMLVGMVQDLVAATNSICELAKHHEELQKLAEELVKLRDKVFEITKKLIKKYGVEIEWFIDKEKMISARFRYYW